MSTTKADDTSATAKQFAWAVLVAMLSVAFSLMLACATPFAAIATVAGANMSRRGALLLTGVAWLANQSVGYVLLGYPQTWDSFAWGGAIGVAALLAACAVLWLRDRIGASRPAIATSFVVAFLVYEIVLFAATTVLPSGEDAFSLQVILQILWPNVLALVGLSLLHRVALSIGLLPHREVVRGGAYA